MAVDQVASALCQRWEVPANVEKRLTFAYGRGLVSSRVTIYGIMSLLIGAFLALSPGIPIVPAAVFLTLLALVFLIFALSPLWTSHWLTRSRLILRQGWYFRAILPLADLQAVISADEATPVRAPLGIHRPLGQPTLYVTGGRKGLVVAKLREPRRFWQAFGLSATEIVFDVADRAAFLQALEERRGLLPPVQAEGAHADLGD
jgi:hypothetical protein